MRARALLISWWHGPIGWSHGLSRKSVPVPRRTQGALILTLDQEQAAPCKTERIAAFSDASDTARRHMGTLYVLRDRVRI